MITFERDGARFNYRTVGVCVEDGWVLLHRAERDEFWSLPGGRVELGEDSAAALGRELHEELGEDSAAEVGWLLWVVENFFTLDGVPYHELGLYYAVTLPPESAWHDKSREHAGIEEDLGGPLRLVFRWFPLAALADLPLYPVFLRTALQRLPAHTERIVNRDARA